MITAEGARILARYNAWQNGWIFETLAGWTDAARRADRGGFFGSVQGTLSHLSWADQIWMSRLAGWEPPGGGIADSVSWAGDWPALSGRRARQDADLVAWTEGLDDAALAGDLSWHSGALGRDMARPRALCVLHMFNHQTHHRGQVHAMLTGAGAATGTTDLFAMPD